MESVVEQLPQTGRLEVTIQASADLNFTALAAQRKVGRFVADEVGYLLRSAPPSLIVSERLCWRVPVTLALPEHGVVGEVGSLDVDVETGQLYVSPGHLVKITQQAEKLAADYSTPAGSPL